jgi:hypothetical protein
MLKYGLWPVLLILVFNLSSARAFVGNPTLLEGIGSPATPAAMCGRTCRSGGFYIPGPPSVCEDRGLEFCGSSRDRGSGWAGTNCRTITIERDDGSVRKIRRCD